MSLQLFLPLHVVSELTTCSQPKGQPRSATSVKPATNGTTTRGGRTRGRGARRGRNAGRAKPKTADELDAEMVDYFDENGAEAADGAVTANAATQPATNGADDLGMEEISVGAIASYALPCANMST